MNTHKVAAEYRRSQWAQIIQARADSGQSIKDFCQKEGISRNAYFYWLRYFHADGYDGYHKLPDRVIVVGCFSHMRRKLFDAMKSLPKDKQAGSNAAKEVEYCWMADWKFRTIGLNAV